MAKSNGFKARYERALLAITANRLCEPQSKLGVWERWLSNVFLPSCVEFLIGPDTVNTIPPATLDALRDHGRPRQTLHEDIGHAAQVLKSLASVGVDLTDVPDYLLVQGLELFDQAYDQLLSALEKARSKASGVLAES